MKKIMACSEMSLQRGGVAICDSMIIPVWGGGGGGGGPPKSLPPRGRGVSNDVVTHLKSLPGNVKMSLCHKITVLG